jgi:diacylglycerol kinase
LIQRNIQTKQLSTKLDHKKLELFKIKRIIRLINYKLVLPRTINIYPVFHISLLELILLEVLLVLVIEIELVNPNIKYKVEEILDYK